MPKKTNRIATIADMAALPFRPMAPSLIEGMRRLASCQGLENPYLISLRIALKINAMGRPAAKQFAAALSEKYVAADQSSTRELRDLAQEAHEALEATARTFRAMAEFVEAADTRLLCSLAAWATEDEAA